MILSNRKHFIGFHVTKEVRDRLREEAAQHKMSVSLLLYEVCLDVLEMREECLTTESSSPNLPTTKN